MHRNPALFSLTMMDKHGELVYCLTNDQEWLIPMVCKVKMAQSI